MQNAAPPKVYEASTNEASTVQEAGSHLRTFPNVKAVEVNTKKGIKEVAVKYNVTFPNIDFSDIE